MEIRLSGHAKNKLRLYKLAAKDVEEAINLGERLQRGEKWESQHGKLRVLWVMVGSYALVITLIKSR
jgi:hypothetical protein